VKGGGGVALGLGVRALPLTVEKRLSATAAAKGSGKRWEFMGISYSGGLGVGRCELILPQSKIRG
jgi:hypothetical protein